MDCVLLKSGYDKVKLMKDLKIAINIKGFINPEKISEKTFSLSKETYGWEALPLNTIHGKEDNKSAIPVNINENHIFLPNRILKECKYIQEILNELNTEIYLVRIMRLKPGGYISPHVDKLIDKKNVIRCQIPIITDNEVVFSLNGKKYDMEAGNLYFINVGEKFHWLKNNSKNDRFTLVIDMKPTKEITEKI
jgi:quercetin dioxygenase-like cupin family protein